MRLFALSALYIFSLLPCKADTGLLYNPQADGSWIEYTNYRVGGIYFGPGTLVPIIWRLPSKNSPVRITATDADFTQFHPVKVFKTQLVYPSSPPSNPGCLYDAVGHYNGTVYFGEVGDPTRGFTVTPGEPKLPLNPWAGENLEIDHQLSDPENGQLICGVLHTSFWVLGRISWGIWPDCWLTVLVERPGTPDATVYSYVYANGIGLVDLWWGPIDARGNVGSLENPAHELQAMAWGKN
jgi:hypothetical protein